MKLEDAKTLAWGYTLAEIARGLGLVDTWQNDPADRTAARLAREGIAQYRSTAVLGRPATIAERRTLSRALVALENDELIDRLLDHRGVWAIRVRTQTEQ